MAISKTQNYLVLNYGASPVSVSTKYDSFLIDGGSEESPGSLPLSFDEIAVINSKSVAFKIGLLRFEPAVEAELYTALAIPNWQDIMTQRQIEEMLLHPTMEDMQKVLDIENEAYFERIRGAMVALKNLGADITTNTERIIEGRRAEFAKRQRKSQIKLTANDTAKPAAHTQEEFDSMKNELAELKAMMAKMLETSAEKAPAVEKAAAKTADKPAEKKPAAPKQTKAADTKKAAAK